MAEIIRITTDQEIKQTYVIMKQLRPHLVEEEYVTQIKRLQQNQGYHLIAVRDDEGQIKSAAGYRINESLAWGTYLYVDDLITDSSSRSNGYAKLLFDWLEAEALNYQCTQFHLDSGVHRFDAHRFYLNRRMDITAHHFQKNL